MKTAVVESGMAARVARALTRKWVAAARSGRSAQQPSRFAALMVCLLWPLLAHSQGWRVLAEVNPLIPDAGWQSLQCEGRIETAAAAIRRAQAGPQGRFRVEKPIGEPPHFVLEVGKGDPTTARASRCEFVLGASASNALPADDLFWHAFRIRWGPWHGSIDRQLVTQWHSGDSATDLLPIFSFVVRGASLRILVRSDTSDAPSRSTTRLQDLLEIDNVSGDRWLTVVVRARFGAEDRGLVQVWFDGALVAEHWGAVGYPKSDARAYAKQGIYHWSDASNPWDTSVRVRSVKLQRAVVISDPGEVLREEEVRRLVSPSATSTN